MLALEHGVVLPARVAPDEVTSGETRSLAFDHLGHAAAGHHIAGLDGGAVGRAPHPRAVGGVEGDVARAHQHLAIARARNGAFRGLEDVGGELSGGQVVDHELSVCGH